jgi:peptidoglycan/LPS O-acetylase OafA/YrhL
MVHTAGDEFGKPRGPVRFMLRRLARIVPLYWLFLVFAVAREWRHGPLDLGWVAASFAFLPHLNPAGLVRPVLGVGWTLNFEMLFYVLFAGALFMPKRQGLVALFSTLAALVAFGVVLRPESAAFATWTSPVVLLFAAGAGLALFKLPMPPLEVPTLSKLGDASYATYLVHGFLLGLTAKLCPPLLYVPAMLVVANVAGLVVHVTVEKRLARWLKPRVEPAPLKAAA